MCVQTRESVSSMVKIVHDPATKMGYHVPSSLHVNDVELYITINRDIKNERSFAQIIYL